MTDIFKEFPLLTLAEAATECAARFKLISKEEKQVYKAMATEDKYRYMKELEEFQQKSGVAAGNVVSKDKEKTVSGTSAAKEEGTTEKGDDIKNMDIEKTVNDTKEEEDDDDIAWTPTAPVPLADLPKYSEMMDPHDHYVEEQAWRYHNPPLPPFQDFVPVRSGKGEAPPVQQPELPHDAYVLPEDLRPLPPAFPLPELPKTSFCKWHFDEDCRVLYADFRRPNGGDVVVTEEDEEFLLKMFERDDITVVSEGLVSGLDKDKWTLDYISKVNGDEYFHKFRRFDREGNNVDTKVTSKKNADSSPTEESTSNGAVVKLEEPVAIDGDTGAGTAKDSDKETESKDDQKAGTTGIAEDTGKETESKDEPLIDVRHIEVDKCLSMKVSDYVEYLKRRKSCLRDGVNSLEFTFIDHLGVECTIDVVKSVLYMIDYDMVKLLPTVYADFLASFKVPGILPGGIHCMMNSVNVNGRPFMGPNVYITPPASFTHFHQDGHGTVDSGHFCVSGYNEVILLRRLTERHKRHALRLLTGGDRKGAPHTFEALYNLPHGDGLVSLLK